MAIYKAIEPISHDLKTYMPGDELQLTAEQAELLAEIVVLVKADEPKPAVKAKAE